MLPYCHAEDRLNETDRVPEPPALSIDAKAACLIDTETGDVLYSMNESDRLYPASTTKIMTCYLTLKYGNLNELYTLPDNISSGMDESSSTANLQPGETLYISELLQCLMISSANEAANALAVYISGSIDAFVDLMNSEAEALGCYNTHFDNPNGLHSDAHYTSAEDLALITLAALKYDTFRELCGTASATIRATNLSDERTLENTNYLLPGTDYPAYDYDGAEGVKTGHTTPAGYCLVSLANRSGHELLGVVLGAEATETDEDVQIGSFTESIRLLDWGFENYDTAVIYQQYLTEASEITVAPSEHEDSAAWNTATETEALPTSGTISEQSSLSAADSASEETADTEATRIPEGTEAVQSDAAGQPDSVQEASTPEASVSPAESSISAFAVEKLEAIAGRLKITGADVVLLLAGFLILLILFILLLICCSARRKQVKRHAI